MSPQASSATPMPGDDESRILVDDWRASLRASCPAARELLAGLASASLTPLADLFYEVMLGDARAARFLTHSQVSQRLKPSMQRWIRSLLEATEGSIQELVLSNQHVGRVHARINVPVDLVARGIRVLRLRLSQTIAATDADARTRMDAIAVLNTSMDIAIESMSLAYADANERTSRTDAAFRLFSLVQNVGAERERQRALLLDWENTLLYTIAGHGGTNGENPHLAASEFGLWFVHKGLPSFGDNTETARIVQLIAQVDHGLDQISAGPGDAAAQAAVLRDIRTDLASIRHLLGMLFERVGELDAGSDALTNLLNRRFLPPVLRREIELSSRTRRPFALLLLDLDHFKQINDSHGHDAGDRALQHVATLLGQNTRGSDYLFRLGGEEFLIVAVSIGDRQAVDLAESLRERIAASPLTLANGESLTITASIGVAIHDGDPDYERLIARADAAMYAAKHEGRNRVALASAENSGNAQRRAISER
ncbi:GGDEF domain-containing protein [Denitratimonas sp. CY0512]|uniref:GGDEF domain-containing protein n=1 Tax=Denitratimonas sp. CY0512 TaxID=3131940 RepID=UPI0030B38C4C